MQLENSFIVPVPIDDAWRVLLDIERIAPCMPGAALDSVTGDDFTGRVKVKLGPINLTYAGKASFIEKDEATHKAVIDARGKDQRGNGTAAAVVTAQLQDEGTSTRVNVLTDLNITGRPAQFGRGVMTDVGNKLLGQFADKLAAQLGTSDEQHALDQAAAAEKQEPTVKGAVAEAAATAAGAVGEVAESVASTDADNPVAEAARTAGAATAQAADKAADKASSAAKAPSKPPSGTTAPPNKPGTSGPAASRPRPVQSEPEPIDLLEVAGGAAFTQFAKPAAIGVGALVLVALVVRRFRR
ncbi:SRPBCC family protein [Modestobacter sp. Leaf380]|uniref:SRPBCC family protein n=1 Tax=Modestobacter sp. Leaf380 TaxID=1736356 RepID=UPI000701C978|nr:SRPBCC family protein [Modestobacter sp. Leaf380]KQS66622.1 carbon monoxide dehydrogenase [Modestobacter sp. Leaf380]